MWRVGLLKVKRNWPKLLSIKSLNDSIPEQENNVSSMKKTVFIFSALIVALLTLFQLSKYSVNSGNLKIEFAIAGIALVFFVIGILVHKKSLQKNQVVESPTKIDSNKISELGISKREYEILLEISGGLSNKEIAERLFVSESTIKTHLSNLYAKLDAKRRTQAIQKAKEMKIIL